MKSIVKVIALGSVCVALASGVSFADQMRKGKGNHGQQGKRFERLDTNGDGALSAEEFVNGAATRFDKADSNSDGVLSQDELADRMLRRRVERRAARMLKRMDYNGDGKVTKDEIESRSKKRFALMDGNDDGKVEKSEMQRNSKRRGERRHHRKGKMHHRKMRHQKMGERRHRRGYSDN